MEEIFSCPKCSNIDLKVYSIYETVSAGSRNLLKCKVCEKIFSETHSTAMFQLNTEISKVASCLMLRSEGLGQRATAWVLGIHKSTVRDWEDKFSGIKETLKMYLFCDEFVKLTFEGDEVYTRINSNKPASES